jgi:integral membrane sensor domain MASE1
MGKKLSLREVTWQLVTMFLIAFVAVSIAYILTNMPPETYVTLVQLVIAFFAGYLTSQATVTRQGGGSC